MNSNRKSKSAQVPVRIYNACEGEAARRRKRTGKLVRWTDVLFESAAKHLGVKNQQ